VSELAERKRTFIVVFRNTISAQLQIVTFLTARASPTNIPLRLLATRVLLSAMVKLPFEQTTVSKTMFTFCVISMYLKSRIPVVFLSFIAYSGVEYTITTGIPHF
jgi:hypothetical protein